ncbi:MAG: dihydrolipoamide acetyltransferase family protein [Chlamydiales bacterium]|nr:dihydrolipoamide acetyltransferase family protein [Chlamydiales bacterium]
MSKIVTIQLPKLGESILSATVVQWLKRPGDRIEKDEAILEVSTDKVNSEIPSPVAGILKGILVQVDEEVEVDAPLAEIILEANEPKTSEKKAVIEEKRVERPLSSNQEMHGFYSPAVVQMAQTEGISFKELEKIKGTGSCGRITKKDLEVYLKRESVQESIPLDTPSKIKITGLRKAIADTMLRSYQEIPHAALLNEIDVTEVMMFIAREKESFHKKFGVKLTLTSFIIKAIAKALMEYPLLNASIEGDSIVVKQSINVGVAVAVDQGVIVPVIKDVGNKCLVDIAKSVAELAEKTRTSKLQHDDVVDGTITLTNFGMTGTKHGFPIIRQPEVAIIGAGAVQKRVVVVEKDLIAIRSMMDMTLCFDHRVVDGLYGCGFINAIKEHLQNPLEVS